MAGKIKWRVDEAPTGPYRSFFKRGWPSASYHSGDPAARIACDQGYRPADAKSSDHPPLLVHIAEWFDREGQCQSFKWRKLKGTFATLSDAKAAAERFIEAHPEYGPKAPA
ncbi:hypothetical protein [Bosea sp. LjRoot237]|uniref:hypothetical protein n=1 Tax=Bosea sp. LjRoot237 TaxID=3342292 RepID=UPI003ECEE715